MFDTIRKEWEKRPLVLIIGLAILFRLLAAIFAKGWGMLDDHFIVIESAQSWVDGHDYNDWLPGSPGNTGPTGHNLFYPGIHFLLFWLLKWIGLTDPQGKMFIVRLLHGAFSLITVYLGYRITDRLSGMRSARIAGLLLAVIWFMPWMSVRNLVEMTCVPFLMLAYWFILRKDTGSRVLLDYFLAGIFFGLAFNIRPQSVFFPLGLGLVILFQGKWKETGVMTGGWVLVVALLQGGIDYFVWGYPFAELIGYFNVCMASRNDYISLPWYNYFLDILGLFLPPVSFFLFFGFLRTWKKYLIIFIPVLLFFLFHSYFPNKQERFILPLVPFFIMLGSIGWNEFIAQSRFWSKHHLLLRSCWGFFWVVNLILLFVFTFTYSKRARIESMSYLSRYPDITSLMVLDEENNPEQIPKFYLGQWPCCLSEVGLDRSIDSILVQSKRLPEERYPRFILFSSEKKLPELVRKTRKFFPYIVYETTVEPGFMDRTLHWMNPMNRNRTLYIYRNLEFYPVKIQ